MLDHPTGKTVTVGVQRTTTTSAGRVGLRIDLLREQGGLRRHNTAIIVDAQDCSVEPLGAAT
jgi:hypothetical protein